MSALSGKTVALIGGAGFIGHTLALALARRGANVHIVDSLQVNNLLSLVTSPNDRINRKLYQRMIDDRLDLLRDAGIPIHPQDARDYHMLTLMLNRIRPQVVVHLAAVAHANLSNKDPYSTFDHSLRTLENALDSARGNVGQFIYFSSSMVYGNFKAESITEDHVLDPIGIYGTLKLAGEKIVQAYHQVFDLPYTIIRPSALYGPRCISRRVVQIFIEDAACGSPLKLAGGGDERMDFTHIDDLVEGVCLAIGNPAAMNQTFNMTYGESRSLNDLIAIIRGRFKNIAVTYEERDKLMPVRGTMSVDKARSLLGYRPAHPIESGVPAYIDWYRQFDGGNS